MICFVVVVVFCLFVVVFCFVLFVCIILVLFICCCFFIRASPNLKALSRFVADDILKLMFIIFKVSKS